MVVVGSLSVLEVDLAPQAWVPQNFQSSAGSSTSSPGGSSLPGTAGPRTTVPNAGPGPVAEDIHTRSSELVAAHTGKRNTEPHASAPSLCENHGVVSH